MTELRERSYLLRTSTRLRVLSKLNVLAEKLVDGTTQTAILDELSACGQKQDAKASTGEHSQSDPLMIHTIYDGTSNGN